MTDNLLFAMKQHDLLPALVLTLSDNGAVVDLTSATEIRVLLVNQLTKVLTVNAVVTGNASGVVTYQWQAGDTATAGAYSGEVQVTWPGGKPQTWLPNRYFTVQIVADLGP